MNQYFVLTRSKRHQQVISQDSSKYIFRYLDQGASGYKSNLLTLSKRSMESLKMGCILRQLVSYLARQTLFEVPQSSDWWFVQGLNWWSLSSRGGKSFTCTTKMVFVYLFPWLFISTSVVRKVSWLSILCNSLTSLCKRFGLVIIPSVFFITWSNIWRVDSTHLSDLMQENSDDDNSLIPR